MKSIYTSALAVVLALVAMVGTTHAATIKVTSGSLNGARQAAKDTLAQSSCSRITENKLLALMLSIPQWEIFPGNNTLARSPMTLSRFDGIGVRSDNINLYSNDTYPDRKRGHWNPGVGLWQLDTWSVVQNLNHAQRAGTHIGGKPVAAALRDKYCQSDAATKTFLNQNWFGCSSNNTPNKCWNTFYNDIYNASNDTVVANTTAEYDWDGGVHSYSCRFGGNGAQFGCAWYDAEDAEGVLDANDVTGQGSRTPLAAPFFSFTRSNIHYQTWLTSSNLGLKMMKLGSISSGPRTPGQWRNYSGLQVRICNGGSCYWTGWGVAP